MRVSFPDWSYGSNGSSGPMFAFDQGEDWAPNFHVSGAYQPNEAWLGDRSRFGLYIDYYGYFNDQVETSLSKSDGPDLYVAFDGTTAIGTAPPETNAFLSFSYNFWETGIESEVDFDLGERLRFTPSVAVFGGGQQQEYHASISDGGPIGGPTSFDNEFLQDVDTWHAGAGVGLEVGVAVASWLDVYLGGNVAYLRVSSDLKSTDCIDLIAGDDMCDGGFLAAASKDEQTFDTYRAGAEAGLKLNFGNMAFGVVGELRHDFVPEIDNPQSLGIRSRLESNHETSYGGRATMSVAF